MKESKRGFTNFKFRVMENFLTMSNRSEKNHDSHSKRKCIVEIVGCPGAGKTTIKEILINSSLVDGGLKFYSQEHATEEIYLESLSEEKKLIARFFKSTSGKKAENIIRKLAVSYCKSKQIDINYYNIFCHCESIFVGACINSNLQSLRLSFVEFFHNTMIDYSAMMIKCQSFSIKEGEIKKVFVYDEGFSQRAFALKELNADQVEVLDYCLHRPQPDYLFLVDIPEDVRLKRLRNRGSDLARFPVPSFEYLDTMQSLRKAARKSAHLIFLNGEDSAKENAGKIIDYIKNHV